MTVDRLAVLLSCLVLAMAFCPGASLFAEAEKPSPSNIDNAQAVAGTWVLQQVSSVQELERLVPQSLEPALKTPGIRGFCLRVPWKVVDADFALLEAGLKLAQRHNLAYSVRFMAGRHTPDRVFDKGCRFYLLPPGRRRSQPEKVPVPSWPTVRRTRSSSRSTMHSSDAWRGGAEPTACGCCIWRGTDRSGPS